MPPRTQYLPVNGISQTDDERTAREARMSASISKSRIKVDKIFMNFCSDLQINMTDWYDGLFNILWYTRSPCFDIRNMTSEYGK